MFARVAAVFLVGLAIGYIISYLAIAPTPPEVEEPGIQVQLPESQPVSPLEIESPILGAKLQPVSKALRTHYDLPSRQGLVISNLPKKSLARQSGLKRGDIILKINGQEVDIESLNKLINKLRRLNKILKTKIIRKGVIQEIKIKLKENNKERK